MGYLLETMTCAILDIILNHIFFRFFFIFFFRRSILRESRNSLFLICNPLKSLMLRVTISNGLRSYK